MAKIGYARVSSADQNLDEQVAQLTAAGCEVIRSEKISGTSTQGREELANVLSFLRTGDELWITRVDRLARSLTDLCKIVNDLKERGITLKATQQPIDNSTPAGNAFLNMLGVFAQFETELRAERQMEGIRRAKAKNPNAFRGRPRKSFDLTRAIELHGKGWNAETIAAELGVSRAVLYKGMRGYWLKPKRLPSITRSEEIEPGKVKLFYADGSSKILASIEETKDDTINHDLVMRQHDATV